MNHYQKPKMNIVELETEDVIKTSDGNLIPDDGGDDDGNWGGFF